MWLSLEVSCPPASLIRELTLLRATSKSLCSHRLSFLPEKNLKRKEGKKIEKPCIKIEGDRRKCGKHELTKNKTNLKYVLFKVFRLVKTK